MKYRTSMKDTKAYNADVVSLSYCEAHNLLNTFEPEAYTCGMNGWNADIYRGTEGGQVIVTGYRPFGRKCRLSYDEVREYDRKAEAIKRDYSRPWEERKAEIEILFSEFCKAI